MLWTLDTNCHSPKQKHAFLNMFIDSRHQVYFTGLKNSKLYRTLFSFSFRMRHVFLLFSLLYPSIGEMICDSDGVKCIAHPSSCTADCDYLLKYKAASADTTQVSSKHPWRRSNKTQGYLLRYSCISSQFTVLQLWEML